MHFSSARRLNEATDVKASAAKFIDEIREKKRQLLEQQQQQSSNDYASISSRDSNKTTLERSSTDRPVQLHSSKMMKPSDISSSDRDVPRSALATKSAAAAGDAIHDHFVSVSSNLDKQSTLDKIDELADASVVSEASKTAISSSHTKSKARLFKMLRSKLKFN